MKIIQHRANGIVPNQIPAVDYAEIDVQVSHNGEIVVGHDLWGVCYGAGLYLKKSRYKKHLLNLKQNLPIEKIDEIAKLFEGRSLGFFDVPFPSAYYAHKRMHVIWTRLSEYEPITNKFSRFWADPLESHGIQDYGNLVVQANKGEEIILASPDLHGKSLDESMEVWNIVNFVNNISNRGNVVGLVTKYPKEALEHFYPKEPVGEVEC